MSTATTSDKFTTDKYTQIRGELRALLGHGPQLLVVTVHPEGQPTALYRLNVDSGELTSGPLGGGGTHLLADDGHVYVAGTDGHIYVAPIDKGAPKSLGPKLDPAPVALAFAGKDRLAAVCGKELVIVGRSNGKELQRLTLGEFGVSVASDPSGVWLVVGGDRGTLSVFDCEDKEKFFAAESKKIHDGAINALMFETEELRVTSVGADNKVLGTHVRGELEPEDRSGKNGHSSGTTAVIPGVADKFYTGGLDANIKIWTRGAGQRKPSSQKEGLAKVVALALVDFKGRPHLVAACKDNTLRLFPVDAGGKVGDRIQLFHGAQTWAEYELKRRDPKLREVSLRALAGWNDATSLELLAGRVTEDEDHGLKVLATELLGATNNPRAIKLLEPLIKANEEAVRLAALAALRKLEGEDSLRILDLALAAQQRDVGTVAIEALARLAKKDDLAYARLTSALGQNPREVRLAALVALESLHPDKSPEPELIALRAKPADIRKTALVRFYQRDMLALPDVQSALRRFSADADAGVRQTAFLISLLTTPKLAAALRFHSKQIHRQLHDIETAPDPTAEVKAAEKPKTGKPDKAKAPSDDDLPKAKKVDPSEVSEADKRPLLEAMASRALDTCLSGATGLASLQDPRALGTLLQLSREQTASVRVETCKALAELADPRGAARLRLMLRDGDASVRDAAFTALTRLEDRAPLAVAEAGLLAEHEDVRRRGLDLLIKQLKKGHEPAAVTLLERALGDAGKSVRTEAFKSALGLEIAGGGPASLRFVLKSLHADVRREVLTEVIGQISQSWAWPLLIELLGDPDPGVRKDAFEFALKRTKGIGLEPLSAALAGKYADLRTEAVKVLAKRKAPGTQELLNKAVDDDDENVRQLAVDALLVGDSEDALTAAMASKHPDVVVRAACARAVLGDPAARAPLQAMIAEPEPEVAQLRTKWLDRAVRALGGLAELGDPAAAAAVLPLLQHKDAKIRQTAAHALAWMARPGNANAIFALKVALQHSDAAVQLEAALGLAFIGEPAGSSLLFTAGKNAPSPDLGLHAALALGLDDVFMAFLDHANDKVRDKALLIILMREMVEGDGVPDRCLAALSSAHPRVRLVAAQALEHFGDDAAFSKFVADLTNDRGEGKAKFTIPPATSRALAEVITFGDARGNPQLKVRAARLLDALREDKQESFDRQWGVFSRRYAGALADAHALADKRSPQKPAYAPDELRQVVFGAYAALSRLPGGNTEMRIRQTALSRLLAGVTPPKDGKPKKGEQAPLAAVQSVLVLALGDPHQTVRKQAFDGLKATGMDATALAAEALATGQRDTGALGLALLAQQGKGAAGLKVLEDVLAVRDDGLEQEAAKLLAELKGGKPQEGESDAAIAARRDAWVYVHKLSLGARSEALRQAAVGGLAGYYEESGKGPAAEALRAALGSKYRAQRFAAAQQLATKKDIAAFDVLVEMLRSDQSGEQTEAIRALQRLGDPRAAAAFMDRIDRDPAGTARVDELLKTAGTFRQVSDATRLLGYLDNPKRRAAAFAALMTISGHDQRIEDPEDNGALSTVPSTSSDADDDDDDDYSDDDDSDDDDSDAPSFQADWEKKQHPRHDDVLVQIAEAARRLSDDRQLQAIALPMRWARGKELDAALAPLITYPKPDIARKATEAIGWRLRKRGGPPDPLSAALKSSDPEISFLAAEGLALAGRGDGISVLLTAIDLLPDLNMRRRAVRALGELGDARALDTFLRLVNEDGHALQDEAAEALGHMGKAAEATPGQSDKIFNILSRLSNGTGTAAQRALVGLRWFGTHEAWKLIRGRAKDENGTTRGTVARLLEYDKDQATLGLIAERLREESWSATAQALAHSLRKLSGADSLEPDYVFLQANQASLEKDTLERLRQRGDPARLIALLPTIKRAEAYLAPVVQILLTRTPLPIDAAAPHLGSVHPRVAAVAAEIIGRAGPSAAKAHGKRLAEVTKAAREAWLAEHARLCDGKTHRLDEVTPPYKAALWASSRLDVAGDELVAAVTLADGSAKPLPARPLRRQAALGLADGAGGKAGAEALRAVLRDSNDADLRSIAAAGLAARSADNASLVPLVLDDAASLARLVPKTGTAGLRPAAGDVHRQGVVLAHLVAAGDGAALIAALKDKKTGETARLALVEALGKLPSDEARTALRTLGSTESEDEELRKAAWRALRRNKRLSISKPARHGRWEVQP
ncbi:MAG: HEAT repeat domain-containing protein [Myxococcales bacterium]|nr:HEAT repeat domain-containing protein [Myxococcales bacterium]